MATKASTRSGSQTKKSKTSSTSSVRGSVTGTGRGGSRSKSAGSSRGTSSSRDMESQSLSGQRGYEDRGQSLGGQRGFESRGYEGRGSQGQDQYQSRGYESQGQYGGGQYGSQRGYEDQQWSGRNESSRGDYTGASRREEAPRRNSNQSDNYRSSGRPSYSDNNESYGDRGYGGGRSAGYRQDNMDEGSGRQRMSGRSQQGSYSNEEPGGRYSRGEAQYQGPQNRQNQAQPWYEEDDMDFDDQESRNSMRAGSRGYSDDMDNDEENLDGDDTQSYRHTQRRSNNQHR